MNKTLFQRILFAILLFSSLQIITLFVELPLYVQFFFLILAYEYFTSFLIIYINETEKSFEELSFQNMFILFFSLVGLTTLYNPKNLSQKMIFELFIIFTAGFSLFKSLCLVRNNTKLNGAICLISMILYFYQKNFILNNLLCFNLAFSTTRLITPKNFKTLVIFLFCWILYESYFVYESTKLLYILSSLECPIKVLFPMISGGFSFIGIMDIIVPGVVLAFILKFDCFRVKIDRKNIFDIDEKDTVYFNFVFSSLFVGMLTLYSVLTNTFKPQAFLCYAGISCVLGIAFLAYKRNEIKELNSFDALGEHILVGEQSLEKKKM